MEVLIDISEVEKDLKHLEMWYPKKMEWVQNQWLLRSAIKIRNEAIGTSKVEARGVTGNYMRGFRHSSVKKDALGKFIMVYNTELYSKVLEVGGYWKKMPPVDVINGELSEWVKRKGLKPKKRKKRKLRVRHKVDTAKGVSAKKASHGRKGKYDWKVKQIAFAVGKALMANKYEGKGQQFRNSPLSGRLLTLKRAVARSISYMENSLSSLIDKAFISR